MKIQRTIKTAVGGNVRNAKLAHFQFHLIFFEISPRIQDLGTLNNDFKPVLTSMNSS